MLTLLLPCLLAQPPADQHVDFATRIHPVLASRCQSCHSGDAAQAGLRMGTREDLLKGGTSGPAIVPGDSARSLLVLKITGRRGDRMPLAAPPLPGDAIALIRAWIDQGAPWQSPAIGPDRPARFGPRRPPVPPGASAHPVDRFLAVYWRKRGIAARAPVPDARFARRAYYDLWGLPPSPEELTAFVRDTSGGKRLRLIDRLLAGRTQYAAHWISFWNDLLRNDEGVVYHGERKPITKWLLSALEKNLPYDAMVRALLNPEAEGDPAGFLTGVTWRGVVSASQSPPMQAAQNSAQVFLGMNLRCAACHDSFVNRWKLRDTYGLAAMFSEDELELVRCDVPAGQKAEPRFPIEGVKVAFGASLESRRRAAAEWFTHGENGRFARTIVNRYWKLLFGRGLVEPADDMEAEPWNPDLLDWLASDFAGHGYDLQHLLRRIMTSRAYSLPAVLEKAHGKDYVFRGPRLRRLTAEQFQDTISSVTGDWRLLVRRDDSYAEYTREWRLKSDPLSRALGRPIRDQVYTERSTEPTTLQALELTNGPLLSHRIERAARALLGQVRSAPENLFDSRMMRSGSKEIDIDITGARELWLVIEDVDSYSPSRVIAGWAEAELAGPQAAVPLGELPGRKPIRDLKSAPVPSMLGWAIAGKGFTRFRARAMIDERCRTSEISPAIRFFVFKEKPDPERLVRIRGTAPRVVPPRNAVELVTRLYRYLLARRPTPAELNTASGAVAGLSPEGVEDLLWALLMSPEFQFIH